MKKIIVFYESKQLAKTLKNELKKSPFTKEDIDKRRLACWTIHLAGKAMVIIAGEAKKVVSACCHLESVYLDKRTDTRGIEARLPKTPKPISRVIAEAHKELTKKPSTDDEDKLKLLCQPLA